MRFRRLNESAPGSGGLDLPRFREEVIRVLLRSGANVNQRLSDGATILHHIAKSTSESFVISQLVEAGADINARALGRDTASHGRRAQRQPSSDRRAHGCRR